MLESIGKNGSNVGPIYGLKAVVSAIMELFPTRLNAPILICNDTSNGSKDQAITFFTIRQAFPAILAKEAFECLDNLPQYSKAAIR